MALQPSDRMDNQVGNAYMMNAMQYSQILLYSVTCINLGEVNVIILSKSAVPLAAVGAQSSTAFTPLPTLHA